MSTIKHAYGKTTYYEETLKISGNCPFPIDRKFHSVYLNVDSVTLAKIMDFCPDIMCRTTKYGNGFYIKCSEELYEEFPEDIQDALEGGKKGFDFVVSISEFTNKAGVVKNSLLLKNARVNHQFDSRKKVKLPSFDD